MVTNHKYSACAQWTNDRNGVVEAAEARQPLCFSARVEFGGEGNLWTPEHFLVASVASCFVTTFRAIAEASKLDISSLEVVAGGLVEKTDSGYRFTQVVLRPELVLTKESDRERALRILEKTERSCLVSRSIAATVRVEPLVTVLATIAG